MEDALSDATARRVLERLGSPEISVDLDGLETLYRVWCENVPFDNSRKLLALEHGDEILPGACAEDFFEHWLAYGTGGTCWPSSNALFALVRHCGFEARRVSGSMMDADIPNHGSVVARIDDQDWLVDSSILSYRPLLLGTGETWHSDVELYPVRVEHSDRGFLITFPGFRGDAMPCRLLQDPVDYDFYLDRYEASRATSVFNDRLCFRRHSPDSITGVLGDTRYSVSSFGSSRVTLERKDAERILEEREMGLSRQVLDRLPDAAFLPWRS